MTSSLQVKRILITGGAVGIGRGIARACHTAGAIVIVADVNASAAQETAVALGEPAQSAMLDVTDLEAIRQFFADLEAPLHGVVNNAGVTIEGEFLDFAQDDLEKLWQTDLRAVFVICQQAARKMKSTGGSIVNISSVHGNASTPGYEMYAAVKAGVTAMTRAMSWSLGQYGVRVNTLSPGLTHTEAVAEVLKKKPHLAEPFKAMHATGRYATVDEIGEVAAFLLSDAAAAITGAEITADHGGSALLVRSDDIV